MKNKKNEATLKPNNQENVKKKIFMNVGLLRYSTFEFLENIISYVENHLTGNSLLRKRIDA